MDDPAPSLAASRTSYAQCVTSYVPIVPMSHFYVSILPLPSTIVT